RWIPGDGSGPSVSTSQLVPYQLFKSFLSSHRALLATVATRLGTLDASLAKEPADPAARQAERAALITLRTLAQRIGDDDAAKFRALVDQLSDAGVGPGSDTRVVVFSERIPTLTWLAEAVPAA